MMAAIDGLKVFTSNPFVDERGRFMRLFDYNLMTSPLENYQIVQVNHSHTNRVGAIRGIHFQGAPSLEGKWVRCIRGRVFDVAVDLRQGSPTFLRHYTIELSEDNAKMIFIPEGCGHGFQVLEPHSELIYLHTAPYDPASEGGVRWNDPLLAIQWPLLPQDISGRDNKHPLLKNDFTGIAV